MNPRKEGYFYFTKLFYLAAANVAFPIRPMVMAAMPATYSLVFLPPYISFVLHPLVNRMIVLGMFSAGTNAGHAFFFLFHCFFVLTFIKIKPGPLVRALSSFLILFVDRLGVEPRTLRLRGACSAG